MQAGRDRAEPQCYRPLDEPGRITGARPLRFAFGPMGVAANSVAGRA